MSRTRTFIAATGAAAAMIGTSIVGASGLASAAPAPAVARIPGSAVPFTSHLRAAGTVAASQKLSVQVWLRPQVAAAKRFAAAVRERLGKGTDDGNDIGPGADARG